MIGPGTKLAHYEILSAIGKGGMGEVWKAKDAKLGREVAIKTLPEEFAKDEDRLARFEREAKLLASLNHPNIAAIHGFEEDDGTHFLVLELVEGLTLAERISSGPIPTEESLRIALQIAEALEAAHEKGVIHRDLKPANVKVTPDGNVKVLDFGLAKAFEGDQSNPNVSNSPTLSMQATQQGVILGTAAYMSPEQARGQSVGKQGDVWAFGCVLYEMLSGRALFSGDVVTEVLASVLKTDPDWSLLPEETPATVRTTLGRCLERDLKQRARDIGDVALAMGGAFEAEREPGSSLSSAPSGFRVGQALAVAVIVLIVGGLISGVWPGSTIGPAQVSRLLLSLFPMDSLSGFGYVHLLDISRDGSQVAFLGISAGEEGSTLSVRQLDESEAFGLLPVGSFPPFNHVFSPDGDSLAYLSGVQVLRIPASGGASTLLSEDATNTNGLSWGSDDWIVYVAARDAGLMRVRADGSGESESLTNPESGVLHRWPQSVGDGRAVMFSSLLPAGAGGWDNASIELLDLETGDVRTVLSGGAGARVTTSGHMVFTRNGALFAAPFDLSRLERTGEPVSVLEGVAYDVATGASQWAVSENGTLVYQEGSAAGSSLMWADSGGSRPAFESERTYYDPALSPDGRFIAVEVLEDGDDIWVLNLERGTSDRISFVPSQEDETPVWSPAGDWIAWSSDRDNERVILRRRADGSGEEETLWSAPVEEHVHVNGFSPEGEFLVFEKQSATTGYDIWLLPLAGDEPERVLIATGFEEHHARVSPDGRWIAYTSDESGTDQIYVQPFPDLGRRVPVSTGSQPVWSADGSRLFYRGATSVWAVSVEPGDTFTPGDPQPLFDDTFYTKGAGHTGYDVAGDGRFIMVGRTDGQRQTASLQIIENWLTEVENRVPSD